MKALFYLVSVIYFNTQCYSQITNIPVGSNQNNELIADAGLTPLTYSSGNLLIGGSPSAIGGTPGYSYDWSPNIDINNISISNPSVTPQTSRTYQLIVTDSLGCTAQDSVEIVSVVSINQNINNSLNIFVINDFSIQPKLVISGAIDMKISFSIVDVSGKKILTKSLNENLNYYEFNIPTNTFSSGVYIINVMINNERITKKFIIK